MRSVYFAECDDFLQLVLTGDADSKKDESL